jgi:hypothetical protein
LGNQEYGKKRKQKIRERERGEGREGGKRKETLDSRTVAIFQEETNLPFSKEEINLSNDAVVQIAEKVENFGSKDVNLDANFKSGGINISDDLHRSSAFCTAKPSQPIP